MKPTIVPEFTRTKPKGGMIRKFLEKSLKRENLSYYTTQDSGCSQES